MVPIATIYNDFSCKFGVPRQSSLSGGMLSKLVFERGFRNREALRGLETFTHIWLLWHFHKAEAGFRPTVRPPRLGGNRRMGVWATRSPFRPNGIGLSCVRIARIELDTTEGPVIWVEDADLMNGTPVLDIKPYLPFTDSHPEASSGWTLECEALNRPLKVRITDEAKRRYEFTPGQWDTICRIISDDPRPHYKKDGDELFSFEFATKTVSFSVCNGVATVC